MKKYFVNSIYILCTRIARKRFVIFKLKYSRKTSVKLHIHTSFKNSVKLTYFTQYKFMKKERELIWRKTRTQDFQENSVKLTYLSIYIVRLVQNIPLIWAFSASTKVFTLIWKIFRENNLQILFLWSQLISQNFWQFPWPGLTLWKNEKFTLTKIFFRQINSLVIHLVNALFSRNFCLKRVRVNFCNCHTTLFWLLLRKVQKF